MERWLAMDLPYTSVDCKPEQSHYKWCSRSKSDTINYLKNIYTLMNHFLGSNSELLDRSISMPRS